MKMDRDNIDITKNIPLNIIFSNKPLNILKKVGINSIDDLTNISLKSLLNVKHVGEKTYKKIECVVNELKNKTFKISYFVKDRDEQILLLRFKDKKTLQDIGNKFGLTRERVRQICDKYYLLFNDLFGSIIDSNTDIKTAYNDFIKNKFNMFDISFKQFEIIFLVLVNYKLLKRNK